MGTPFGGFTFPAVSRAAKRIIGTRVHNKKEPVSPHMIRKLVEKSKLDNLLELLMCVFYSGLICRFLSN